MNEISITSSTALSQDKVAQLVRDFFGSLRGTTLRAYQQSVDDFRVFLNAATTDEAVRQLLSQGHGAANHLALTYRNSMVERELAPATINARLSAVRSLVTLAKTIGLVGWSLDVKNVKSKAYRDTRGPGSKGYRDLVRKVDERQDSKGIRDRAILALLYERALRRNEVATLDMQHVDLQAGTISIVGKGSTERETLTMAAATVKSLADWIAIRGTEPGPLFTTADRAKKGDGRLTGNGLYRMVRVLGERIGQRARPHGLRHAAITAALDATNGDMRKVARFSRHRKLETLALYDDCRQDAAGAVAELVAGS